MNTYDFGYKTLEQVAERVNEGATQGFEHLTSEFLAASYAADAAIEGTESTSDIDADIIEEQLDVLREAGAEFETAEAISIALSLVEQADK